MTQRDLDQRGGSEMFTIEIARELHRRSHEVAIFTSRVGETVRPALVSGVYVEKQLKDIPFVPDIIHGQHHLHLISALTYFQGVPAISYCHGLPWVENPPIHSRIMRYVAICETMKPRLVTGHHIPSERIRTIGNFFDETRFQEVAVTEPRPARAVFYGNFSILQERLDMIADACRQEGYEFNAIGFSHGNMTSQPEAIFSQAKVAFALGRSAVEAMASGCAVIPINFEKVAPLITPGNFTERAASNFCPRIHGHDPWISTEAVRQQLQAVANTDIAKVTHRVRRDHTLSQAVDRLEEVYAEALQEFRNLPATGPAEDLRSLGSYLEKIIPELEQMYKDHTNAKDAQAQLNAWLGKTEKAVSLNEKILPYLKELLALQSSRTRTRIAKLKEVADTHHRLVSYMNSRMLGRFLLKRYHRKKRSAKPPA